MGKKFSIKDMSVKAKITMFSGVMLLFMVILAGTGLFSASTINKARSARYNNYAMNEYNLSEAFSNFCNIKVRIRNMPIMYYAPDVQIDYSDQITKINNYEKVMNEYFSKFEASLDEFENPEIATKYADMKESVEKWMANTRDDIALFETSDKAKVEAGMNDLMQNGRAIADEAEAELSELVELLTEESDKNGEQVNRELAVMTGILIAVAVIAFVITFLYAMMLIRMITVPVAMISKAAQQMAVGDVDVDCTKLAEDDLGELIDNFSHMVESTKEQANIAQHLAAGDMTVSVTPRGEKDMLGKAFMKLTEDQNRTLTDVNESTMQVTLGAEQVAMASQSLAQGATEQASALEEVTASMNDIAERTKNNATDANHANELVHDVKQKAISGNEQMKAMRDAMLDINKTSEMISKVIKVIDDIAFQTNILALNAAVEAARAGVHGKGFSVVAEEVRNLAGKSAGAAAETAEMIENAIRKIQNGTQLAEETEHSLNAITTAIDEIVDLIVTIANASNDQATAVSQVDQAMSQVSQVVQTNSATSQECAAASEELSNQAANLRNLMSTFKLKGGSGSSNGSDLGFGVSKGTFSNSGSNSSNEQIISLDGGEFGKY